MQQYNPWREQLVAGIVTPFISDMIQRNREANQAKKLNAIFSEAQNLVNGNQGQSLLAAQPTPEGYSSVTPWESVARNSYNPLTQFDMGTTGIAPTTQGQQSLFSSQDYRNAIMKLLGTKRFSMLNPALVEQYLTPFYQATDQARQEALKKEYADKLAKAQNPGDRRSVAWEGATQGVLPWDVVNAANSEYRYENPSAAENAANLFREKQFDEGVRQFDTGTSLTREKMADDRQRDAQAQRNWEKIFEAGREDARYARENPGYSSVFTGDDGGQWVVDRDGNTKKLDTGEGDINTLSVQDRAQIEYSQKRIKELEENRMKFRQMQTDIFKTGATSLVSDVDALNESEYMKGLKNELQRIDYEIAEEREKINKIWSKYSGGNAQISGNDVSAFPENRGSGNGKKNSNYQERGISKWKYGSYIDKAAKNYGVNPALIQAIISVESAENPKATSSAGAQGLMQLMPKTAKELGVNNPYDEEENINGGTKYLARLLKMYNGDVEKALWAYNAGEGNVAKGRKPKETRDYVPKVMKKYKEYANVKGEENSNDLFPTAISDEDYRGMLKKAIAGKYPGVSNEKELQEYLRKNGIKFSADIKPQDVNVF